MISGPLPEDSDYPVDFRDFTVQHEYLTSSNPDAQTRLRKRGIVGSPFFLFTLTQRKTGSATEDGQTIEIRRTIPLREYEMLLAQRDPLRDSITKKRRCFVWKSQYFQLDTYMNTEGPLKGLAILEAYVHQHPASIHAAACKSGSTPNEESCERSPSPVDSWMPPFVQIEREVTNDPHFSMFTLSLAQKHQ